MIEPVRQEVLLLLAELSDVAPEVPLGQLMANIATLACGPADTAIREVTDAELLEAGRESLDRYRVAYARTPTKLVPREPFSRGVRLSG